MINAKDLKTETEAFLKKRGYPVNPNLPKLEELADLRIASSLDVRRRCLILASVCGRAYGAKYELVVPWIDIHGLRGYCTQDEVELIDEKAPSESQKAPFRPQPEAMWEFAWVLKMIPAVDHFKSCSDKLVHMFPKPGDDPSAFLAATDMQDSEALYREADRLYRLHWAVRDAALNGRKPPNGQDEYVTLYRLQAINWATQCDVPWDEADVST
ncbi:MAG TPA: DUF4272 domain-containing protein [Fimbriiglobus sp.]|jgi:hypothetical protein